jgi:hypothetical protein
MLVRVFRNITAGRLHGSPTYSIQARVKGSWRTVAHASHVDLTAPDQGGVRFPVSAAGVARIRTFGRKQVVATVVGHLVAWRCAGRLLLKPFVLGTPIEEALLAYHEPSREAFETSDGADQWSRATFNPYRHESFMVGDQRLAAAHGALLTDRGLFALGPLDTFLPA